MSTEIEIRQKLIERGTSKINQQAIYLLTFVIGSFQLLNMEIPEKVLTLVGMSKANSFAFIIGLSVIIALQFIGRLMYWNAYSSGALHCKIYTLDELNQHYPTYAGRIDIDKNIIWLLNLSLVDFARRENKHKDRKKTWKSQIGYLFSTDLRWRIVGLLIFLWIIIWDNLVRVQYLFT